MLRLPVQLYEHGLGWLLGHRFVEITHRGRHSGRLRRTVVEVVRFVPTTREVIVVSAWHGTTDWFRNIQRRPALAIRSGRLSFVPEQRILTSEETLCEMQLYLQRHRLAGRLMPWLFGSNTLASDNTAGDVQAFFRGVSFRPAGQR